MPQYDLPEHELQTYRTSAVPPADLASFWGETLDEARGVWWAPKVEQIEAGLRLIDVYDVTFSGFAGDPIKAWYRRPAGVTADLPVVVRYQGYTGGRGLPHQVGAFPLAGWATLEIDSRGQGTGAGYVGDTADPHGHGPTYLGGFMTRGVLDRREYYYRRLFTDAVLAVDAAKVLPGAAADQVAIHGVSQGGGVALAVASLRDDLIAVMADVPFLSDFPRAVRTASTGPYLELAAYLASHRDHLDQVMATLANFDVATLVAWAQAPAMISVALMDTVCPPSTVYAAYNAYAGPKELHTYPFNDHEGGQFHQEAIQLQWLADLLA